MVTNNVVSNEGPQQQIPRRSFYRLTALLIVVFIALFSLSFFKPRATKVDKTIAYIFVDGDVKEFSFDRGGEEMTVRDALRLAAVRMGPDDRVVPVRETSLHEDIRIEVIRVRREAINETDVIPFATVRWADPHLPAGETRLVREGREGMIEQTFNLTYENDKLAHRKLLSTRVIEDVVDEIIGVGMGGASPVLQTETGDYHYVEVKDMIATAYTPGEESTGEWADGYTFTGLRAGYGVVAVDPEVIPLGTMLYIPGYGEAVAGDIGGAIKGERIDLGFESVEEALEYGRKPVQVYVLAQ